MEPHISPDAVAALYAPTGAIVCPFGLTYALAENAAKNGVRFQFDTEVMDITPISGGWKLETTQGPLETKVVVNAAGVYADRLHNMVSHEPMTIVPRRGTIFCWIAAPRVSSATPYSNFPQNTAKAFWSAPPSTATPSWALLPSISRIRTAYPPPKRVWNRYAPIRTCHTGSAPAPDHHQLCRTPCPRCAPSVHHRGNCTGICGLRRDRVPGAELLPRHR